MKPEQQLLIGLGVVVVAAVVAWEAVYGLPKREGAEITPETITVGLLHPTLWIFYNDSDINSRQAWDFGARNSKAINIPLLNVLYQRIAAHNGSTYKIEVLGGLSGVAAKLGWDAMPRSLQNPKASVSAPEEDWIRTAILAKYGGLWMSPSSISLKGIGQLPADTIVALGSDSDTMYTSSAPGFRGLWVPTANNPMMVAWEQRLKTRLEGQLGGRQVRGDSKSDWAELSGQPGIKTAILSQYELGRNPYSSKKIELEDIFAAGTEGRLPFEIPKEAAYIPIPYAELLDRRAWGWVLRMSEEQIMTSDLVITHILQL
jgi:hypothetical protein